MNYPQNHNTQTPAQVNPTPQLPELEKRVLAYWQKNQTFTASIQKRLNENAPEWVFNDGPPFANGLPHYGHLLTGYAKDVFPRFQTMRGKHVERRFGWDTHGLPAELEAMKQLGITEKSEIETMGIAAFNRKAREAVLQYTAEWEEYVTRQARWVDFPGGYKTLDLNYMESVIWAFKQLYDKGLAYEGARILPYCWRDETPLSNHELRMDDDVYKTRQDPSVTVTFPFTGKKAQQLGLTDVNALAWTTTPWTLPTNQALAVGPNILYAVIPEGPKGAANNTGQNTGNPTRYLLALEQVTQHAEDLGYENSETAHAAIQQTIEGKQLAKITYKPLFTHYTNTEKWQTGNCWQVLVDDYVTTSDGTGLVHQAPAYGEDDQRVTSAAGIPVIMSLDDSGRFLPDIKEVAGMRWDEANRPLIRAIKQKGRLLRERSYEHSYPHCWRCRNPLIYRAVSSWFVNVTKIKNQLLQTNEHINWVPENVKHGQFGKWLQGARDWSISRNRYWGTPIPVWVSDNPDHPRIDVYGSLKQIKKDFGKLPVNEQGETDLHRPYIDELTRPNPDDPTGKSTMRRIPDVLDVWFDSGSMPFAQAHYPFENQDWFDTHQPCDFIVEYIGQTRGWFYVQHVLATALFSRPAFKNVVSHGIVLGSDGNKMSKSLKNYPDVSEVFQRDGADAMRWFLMASPVVRGGNLIVTEEGIREGVRQFILPIWNTWYFFSLYANADNYTATWRTNSKDPLDRYILTKTRHTIENVQTHLEKLDTTNACETLRDFAETLTNWYVRRSRDRFWEGTATAGQAGKDAFDTLYTVLETIARTAAPLAPLVTEELWQGLTGGRSIHLENWPNSEKLPQENQLVAAMDELRQITSQAQALRKNRGLRVRLPLATLTVVTKNPDALTPYAHILREELNVKKVNFTQLKETSAKEHGIIQELTINARTAGPRLGREVQNVIRAAKTGNWHKDQNGTVHVAETALQPGEYELTLKVETPPAAKTGATATTATANTNALTLLPGGGFLILDITLTPQLQAEGLARDAIRAIQEARKEAGLLVSDRIQLQLAAKPEQAAALQENKNLISTETLATKISITNKKPDTHPAATNTNDYTCQKNALDQTKEPLEIRLRVCTN